MAALGTGVARLRRLRRLTHGISTAGIIVDVRERTVQSGPTGQRDVVVEFAAHGVPQTAVFAIDGIDEDLAVRDMNARRPIRLLFHPRHPKRIVVLEWLAETAAA